MPDTAPRQFETIYDAARRLRVSPRAVERWISTGQLAAYKIGATTRLDVAEVDAFARPIHTTAGVA